jgi:type I restriction enzyme S subunit
MKNNETKNRIAPKLRFPEFRDAGEWAEKTLNELGEFVPGLQYASDDVRDKGLLVLGTSSIQNNEITLEDCVYVSPNIEGANLSEPNDILICVRSNLKSRIGKSALIPFGLPSCTHGSRMSVFRSESAKFIFQLFQTKSYDRQVSAALETTINAISGEQLKKYRFYIPDSSEQQKIADCLSSIDELIAAHSQKLENLKAHKKGLMQQLLPAEGKTVPKLRFPNESGALTPCGNEQQKIADCLSSIDELISAQSQKLESLKAHKKGLMQQLLFPDR